MTDPLLQPGDIVSAVVTRSAPFGVLVESDAGVPGLVPSSSAQPGDRLSLRVDSFDAAKGRFSATLA